MGRNDLSWGDNGGLAHDLLELRVCFYLPQRIPSLSDRLLLAAHCNTIVPDREEGSLQASDGAHGIQLDYIHCRCHRTGVFRDLRPGGDCPDSERGLPGYKSLNSIRSCWRHSATRPTDICPCQEEGFN